MTETIFALASSTGVAGVAVLRVSGIQTKSVVEILTNYPVSQDRRAVLRAFKNPKTGNLIDKGLVLWFPGPHSFTGEDVVEFHIHGGLAIISEFKKTLIQLKCRPAEPGEFSRRALENGKMDLIAVEALDQMIRAKDPANLKLAQGQSGRMRQKVFGKWRNVLIELQASCEALIDFPEDDLPEELIKKNQNDLAELLKEIEDLNFRSDLAQTLDNGLEILLVGPPNAGKSTLLNSLAGYERAIVSQIPGTTRDFVELDLQLGAFSVRFVDTAGLRNSNDHIESLGIERTQARIKQAALILNLFDPNQDPEPLETTSPVWPVQTKGLVDKFRSVSAAELGSPGVDKLLNDITTWLDQTYGVVFEDLSFQKDRQLFHVKQVLSSLKLASTYNLLPELQAEHLRQASLALGYLSGKIHVEDVLDTLFSGFCIGK